MGVHEEISAAGLGLLETLTFVWQAYHQGGNGGKEIQERRCPAMVVDEER